MAQKRAAYKAMRQSKKQHLRNVKITSEIKTFVKKFNVLLSEKKFDEAKTYLRAVSSKLDKATSKGVIRKNTVSSKISRLSKTLSRAAIPKK